MKIKVLIISLLFFVLLSSLPSCETNDNIDWELLYQDMKQNNEIISQRNEEIFWATAKQSELYPQFIPLREKSAKISLMTRTFETLLKEVKTKIQKDLKIDGMTDKEKVIALNDKASPHNILFKQHYLDVQNVV